uniref:ORF44d n=1 Tax=Pinus koraiensis TaxID=88728 RepID=A4QMK1_PINKO|nr:ORF44d [Pinus koraiensis]ABP35382.1 ORF44d [Pinus koraiensis]
MVGAIPNRKRILFKRISSNCNRTWIVEHLALLAIRTYFSKCSQV